MRTKQVRNFAFTLHRYLGLVLGLIIVIIGLTGSVLVFRHEIEQFLVTQQFGQITPEGEKASLKVMLDSVKENYSDRPEFKVYSLNIPEKPDLPYQLWVRSPDDKWIQVFVNPYTGKVIGSRPWDTTFFSWVYRLHYELLAGEVGFIFVGIVAFLLVILSITGIVLWPGWRKLIAGFKIKFNAHPKRVNFDVHKVTGIVVAIFLGLIAFTGFCWNFYEHSEPLIYAATFTPKPPEPTSKPIPSRSALTVDELVEKVRNVLPEARLERISLPQTPEAAFEARKKFPQSLNNYGLSSVYLDQYTGQILGINNELEPSRAEAVLNSFVPIHYGTFAGLPSRIFYLFVGLAPLILYITGLVMWWYRRQPKNQQSSIVSEVKPPLSS